MLAASQPVNIFPRSSERTIDPPQTGIQKITNLAKTYAGIIDSRESITRLILDITAFDIPTICSSATRNWKSFLEGCFESAWSTTSLILAPFMTKTIAWLSSNFILQNDERKHFEKILKFYRGELTDETSFQKGLERILAEEPKDQERVARLYSEMKNYKLAKQNLAAAEEQKDFFTNLQFDHSAIKRFNRLKEATIIGESAVEGCMWGGFGLALRWFRRNILKEDRFTGTKKYLSDKDSKKLGENEEISMMQRVLGGIAMFLGPSVNSIFMKLTRDKTLVEKSKFLQALSSSLDMTHGLYPRLGLLFTYTTLPKWFSVFSTTQGLDEWLERLMKFCTIIPSWWLGHRIANGSLAAYYDKKLAEKYNVDRGILLEPKYVGKFAPDPAKIHHVLEATEHNAELQKEARGAHAKVLYAGITLHSVGVFLVSMLVNQITKWRVQSRLKGPRL